MTHEFSVESETHGRRKYPTSALLKSSAALGWSTIAAELRSHGRSETPVVVPTHTEVTLAVRGNADAIVRRTGAGIVQRTNAFPGAIWITPIGVGDNTITITDHLPQTLHLFLPTSLFTGLYNDFNLPGLPAQSVRYVAGVRDEFIEQLAGSILAEMVTESAAGRMFVETASLMLAARLLRSYCDIGARAPLDTDVQLNHVRMRRVLDYVAAHLADEMTLADLARVACLSQFHFARTFSQAMGVPPHRYISRLRLQNAMTEIAAGKLPLAQIALNARFSSQASFTRAFRRATGISPGEYRRRARIA